MEVQKPSLAQSTQELGKAWKGEKTFAACFHSRFYACQHTTENKNKQTWKSLSHKINPNKGPSASCLSTRQIYTHKRVKPPWLSLTWITTRGDWEKYHKGIPKRLINAVLVSYVSEQRVLKMLPPQRDKRQVNMYTHVYSILQETIQIC